MFEGREALSPLRIRVLSQAWVGCGNRDRVIILGKQQSLAPLSANEIPLATVIYWFEGLALIDLRVV